MLWQVVSAVVGAAAVIVTRNIADFTGASLPAMIPEDFPRGLSVVAKAMAESSYTIHRPIRMALSEEHIGMQSG